MIAVGDACEAYQLQIPLTAAEGADAVMLQRQLVAMMNDAAVSLPPESLHVTVFPFVDAGDTRGIKGAPWPTQCARWCEALDTILAAMPSFRLRFREARFLEGAAVMIAKSSVLDNLRERIALACAVPGRVFRRMDIVHVTLVRYGTDCCPPANDSLPIAIDVVVNRLRLVRENVYPSLDVTVLRAFQMQPGALFDD